MSRDNANISGFAFSRGDEKMRKKGIVILLLVAIALLASGCVVHYKTNGWIYKDTDGDGTIDCAYRLHQFYKPTELNGTYTEHLNMDRKIFDDAGKVVTVNHVNTQSHVVPQVYPPEPIPPPCAVGYGFSDESVLWVAIVITVDGSGDVEMILDMNGNEAHTLYNNILNIVALGTKYEDGTEYWADTEPL
jgi:hypothetical protein